MNDRHISTQFDNDLNAIIAKLMRMGGKVETQITIAMQALNDFNLALVDQVLHDEADIDADEIEIDADCAHFIARRQPTARDLRMVLAIYKSIANLERAGDEVARVAKRTKSLIEQGVDHSINYTEIKYAGELAIKLLHRSLNAFTRLDTTEAKNIMVDDSAIDDEFRAFVRKLITYMTEDARNIKVGLDFLFIAKAIERIGDHAKNIGEFVIYIVEGADIRHQPMSEVDKIVQS